MQYDAVIVETGDKHVGGITLNRPDSLNTFNTAMANQLLAAFFEKRKPVWREK